MPKLIPSAVGATPHLAKVSRDCELKPPSPEHTEHHAVPDALNPRISRTRARCITSLGDRAGRSSHA